MSRILLSTFGSYGDLHPYLAMAQALRKRGHHIVLATHEDYREYVERIGADFVALAPSLAEMGPEERWTREINHPRRGSEFVVRRIALPSLRANYAALLRAMPGADLVLSHILTFATPIAAEKLQIPWLSVSLQPGSILSVSDPPALPMIPILPRMPKWAVRGVYAISRTVMNSWFRDLQALRRDAGLSPAANPLFDGFSPYGTFALFPDEFAAPQPDWPPQVRQVGFPLFDRETRDHASAELERFLAEGEAPVVFTLGSSVVRSGGRFFEFAHEALKRLKRRGVFLAGVQAPQARDAIGSDNSVHVGEYEPYSQIFPRAAAIVHQCGIGTTAQALASGRPQVMVPFAHDQPDNARRVAGRGLGVMVPAGRMSGKWLENALREVLTPPYAERARHFAAGIPRDGFAQRLGTAVDSLLLTCK